MALIVQIENQSHKVIDSFSDEDDVFLHLCSRVRRDSTEDWRVLSIVDPYSDTMLNRIQQVQLRDELERIRRRPDLLTGGGADLSSPGTDFGRRRRLPDLHRRVGGTGSPWPRRPPADAQSRVGLRP
jgi:hypothetical protein